MRLFRGPAFGSEAFARVDRIECDIRWQTLLGSRLDFSHLRLEHPTLTWSARLEGVGTLNDFFSKAHSIPDGKAGPSRTGNQRSAGFELVDGRINFKLGKARKAFAITDLRAQVSLIRRMTIWNSD